MKKKHLITALAMTVVLAFTGCSSKDSETKPNASVTPEGTETTEPVSYDLTVWSPSEDQDPEYGQWLQTMCEKFDEAHPEWDINFKYGTCTESEAKKVVPQDIDAAADVFLYSSTGLENLCQTNSLTEIGGKYLDSVKENYAPVLVDSLSYENGLYGVPMTTNTFYMYYDKSVFTEEDVKNLDTMLEKGTVAVPVTDGFYLSAFYLGAGCDFFGPEGKDRENGITLDTKNGIDTTKALVDYVKNDNFVVAKPDEAIGMMREGKVDAYICGTWQAAQTEEILGENFGVAALPSFNMDGVPTQMKPFASSKAIGVKSTTKHPQVALELALFLGGYDAQKYHYETRNYVPCFNELLQDAEIQKNPVVMVDAYTIENISVSRANFTEMSYFWTPAESFGTELRDGVITHDNAAEKTKAFNESANSSGL